MTTSNITMIPVTSCNGSPRFIPSDRATTQINTEWLRGKGACRDGLKWFADAHPNGCSYLDLRTSLSENNKPSYERWLVGVVGGDTATAGDEGTATAGYRGTATAGYRGTATAGYRGTATAGDEGTATAGYRGTATAGYRGTATAGYEGTATAGDRGTATAGDRGTATAGDRGTATAGVEGIIRILEWSNELGKYRVITGVIGENGIEPNVAYVVVDGKLTRKEQP